MDKLIKPRFFYGWIVVAACFLTTIAYGLFFSIGVFFKPLQAEFGWSAALTSSIHSFHLIIFIFSTFIIGWSTDRFGPRATLACGGTLIGLGAILCSRVNSLLDFYFYYGMASLGAGIVWVLPASVVQRWFVKARGLTLGIVSAGIGAGIIIYAPVSNHLITIYGWRASYIIIGASTWVLLIIAALLIESSPEKKGLLPYGAEEVKQSSHIDQPDSQHDDQWSFRDALRTRTYWALSSIYFCTLVSIHMVMIHIIPFAVDIGIDKTDAAAALGLIGGVSIAGRVLVGALGQKFGFRRSLILCTALCGITFLWLAGIKVLWMLYVFVIVYGFFYGGKVPQLPGLTGQYFHGKSLATIFGSTYAIALVGGAIGPVIGGLIFDKTGSYHAAFITGAFFWFIAATLAYFIRSPVRIGFKEDSS
jgi:MFS family permease